MNGIDIEQLLAGLPERICDIPRRRATLTPDAPALHDGQRIWTYAELAQAVESTAAQLRNWQLRPGDRLAVIGENCVAQVALTFATAALDAWVVHINGRQAGREVDVILRHSGARLAIFTAAPDTSTSIETIAHAERHEAQVLPSPFGPWMVGALNPHCAPEPVHASSAEQVAALVYTTGTTGTPKAVMLTHRNLLFIAAVSSTLRGLTPNDRAWGVLPISHVYGLTSVMLGTLYAGACLHLCQRYSPDAMLKAIRDDQLTIIQGVPAMYARLLEKLGDSVQHLPSKLRFAYAGGSPLSPTLKADVEKLLGVPLHNGYGLSETSPTVSQTRLDQPRNDTSVGPAIPGVEVRVVSTNDSEVGELWVRGPNVMLGYYQDPEQTAFVMREDGWLNTGDVARQDADGALFIVGRTKELIIRSGFNVYPLEVETVLNAHPAVTQSAVVGRGADDGNEEVVAFVELDPRHPASTDELRHYLASQLAPYKRPAEIIAMAALPAAATGKILKGQLRQLVKKH